MSVPKPPLDNQALEGAKNRKVQIVVALIALVGALGAALVTSWDKLFPPKPVIVITRTPYSGAPPTQESNASARHKEVDEPRGAKKLASVPDLTEPPKSKPPAEIPTLKSVTPISTKAMQKFTVSGTHLGTTPPFNGCSPFIRVTNLMSNRIFGHYAVVNSMYGCWPILVTSWTDTEIVVEGFPSVVPQPPDIFRIGDVLRIDIVNPQQQQSGIDSAGPSQVGTCTVRVNSDSAN